MARIKEIGTVRRKERETGGNEANVFTNESKKTKAQPGITV
jgi:hypothetical protein